MQELVEHLWRGLKGRRYLIVLDDIWDVDPWKKLEESFPDDKNGSRIVFTSRNHDLASQAKPNSICHRLPLFTDEESWKLMKMNIFGCDECPREFSDIGKKIARYCKGLPLAVVLIAAILGGIEQKMNVWDEVALNLKSHLHKAGCGNVIELSYKYLPNHLKCCYLHCGLFSRGGNIKAKILKLFWIADGFIIQDRDSQSLEDLASDYLDKLASQNLIVVTERSSMGGIKMFNVHDLLYDMCLEKAREDNFLYWTVESVVLDQYMSSSTQKYNHHRLCIGKSDPFIQSKPIATKKEMIMSPLHFLQWRSFSHNGFSYRFLENFKVLTVLDLDLDFQQVQGVGRFPEVILSIIHLRYLTLHFFFFIGDIPREINDLWNLDTLVITYPLGLAILLPVTMWKIKSLRYVDVKDGNLDLKYHENNFAAFNVERLGSVELVCDSRTSEFLLRFPKLRKLDCRIDGKEHFLELFSMVGSLTSLEALKIHCTGSFDVDFYEKKVILNFPKNENLKKLTLDKSHLPWHVVSVIENQFPNLEVLKLYHNSCVGYTWELEDGGFSKLRSLTLNGLDIKEIDVSQCESDTPFPCLEHLVIIRCGNFEKIPPIFEEINTLKTIKLNLCHEEVENSAMEIQEQQIDYGNDNFHVMISHSRERR